MVGGFEEENDNKIAFRNPVLAKKRAYTDVSPKSLGKQVLSGLHQKSLQLLALAKKTIFTL